MTEKAKPTVDQWSGEFGDSLTGHEEILIRKGFGQTIDQLGAEGGMTGLRALIFAHKLRGGMKTRDAKDYALGLTRAEVAAYFAGIGNRPDGDDSEGEEGALET